jgi:hypothetical protein
VPRGQGRLIPVFAHWQAGFFFPEADGDKLSPPRKRVGRRHAVPPNGSLAVLTHLPAYLIDLIDQAIDHPIDSLADLAQSSAGALRLRTAETLGAVFTAHQVAQHLGIPKALGVKESLGPRNQAEA